MKFFATIAPKRVTNFALALMLVLSTVAASVPFIFSDQAGAVSGMICTGGCDTAQINAAITAADANDVLTLDGDVNLTAGSLKITKPLTLQGNGHSINANFAKSGADNAAINTSNISGIVISQLTVAGTGDTNLHGINIFKGSVSLNDVTIQDFSNYGLVVNGADVTVNNITTSGNGWGGVDVDQSSTSNPAKLTVNGVSHHTDVGNAGFLGVKHLFIDNVTKPVSIVDTNGQYTVSSFGNARFYKLNVPPATPGTPRFNGSVACGYVTNINYTTPTWDAVANAVSYNYRANLPDGSVYGPINVGNLTSVSGVFGGEGISSFNVQAVAANGLTSGWSANCAATYDATLPAAPLNGAPTATNTNNFNFTWDAVTDGGSPITTYQFQSSTSPAMTSPWQNWINFAYPDQQTLTTPAIHSQGAGDGTYYWQARAIDAAGNVGPWSTVWTTTIDSTPSTAPSNAQWLNSTTNAVLGAYTNQNPTTPVWTAPTIGTVNHYEYSFKSPTASWSAWQSVGNVTNLGPNSFYGAGNTGTQGEWQFKVRTINNFNIASSETLSPTITYDRTKPTVTLTSPTVALTNSPTTLEITANDNFALNKVVANVYKVGVAGVFKNTQATVPGTATSYSHSVDISSFTDGDYYVKFNATDKAGNVSSTTTFNFTVDKTAPVVDITAPTDLSTVGHDALVPIAGTIGDATSYELFVDGTSVETGTSFSGYNWDTAGLASGDYSIKLVAKDAANNEGSKQITVTVDNTNPALTVDAGTVSGNTATITGTAELGATLSATFNGVTGPVTNTSGTWTFTASGLANGTYAFSITATDSFGNATTGTTTATVAVVAPATTPTTTIAPAIISPAAAAVLGATTDGTTTPGTNNGSADVEGASTDKTAKVDTDATDGSIFGLAWYWWILILAALAAIIAWIVAAIRRRNEAQS